MIFPKKKEIIIWKEDILHLEIWFQEMWPVRAAKERCDAGYGVGTSKQAVYLDYADAIERYGKIECSKHGNRKSICLKKYGSMVKKW